MTIIGPIYPAHIALSQAEVRLVATDHDRADEHSLRNAQEIQAAEAHEIDVVA